MFYNSVNILSIPNLPEFLEDLDQSGYTYDIVCTAHDKPHVAKEPAVSVFIIFKTIPGFTFPIPEDVKWEPTFKMFSNQSTNRIMNISFDHDIAGTIPTVPVDEQVPLIMIHIECYDGTLTFDTFENNGENCYPIKRGPTPYSWEWSEDNGDFPTWSFETLWPITGWTKHMKVEIIPVSTLLEYIHLQLSSKFFTNYGRLINRQQDINTNKFLYSGWMNQTIKYLIAGERKIFKLRIKEDLIGPPKHSTSEYFINPKDDEPYPYFWPEWIVANGLVDPMDGLRELLPF